MDTAPKQFKIPVYKPSLCGREKEYVNQCLDSSWISSKGIFVAKFEQEFQRYIGGNAFVTSVSNGTVAIHLALKTLGIGVDDEVIVPTFTYVASVNAIVQAGAKAVFVDSKEDSLQIDPECVLRKITPRTKAVMCVHLYGLACDMDQLISICTEKNIFLIEDCAEAFGSYFDNQHVGTFGDIATFSFFGNKTITTGEGGMVVAKEESLIAKAFHLKNQGVSPVREYWHDVIAYNYRMTNICAAIGLAQLERANELIQKKRQIAQVYKKLLSSLPIRFHDELPRTVHSYWMCTLLVENPEHRDALREHLTSHGIESRPLFYPCHTFPHLKTEESFPIAEKISRRGINLPSYPELSLDEINYICEVMHDFFVMFRKDVDGVNFHTPNSTSQLSCAHY